MTLTKEDLETGLEKYKKAIENAENDREFAQIVVEALENKIKNIEEKEYIKEIEQKESE